MTQSFDVLLDTSELRCPMPLLKTKQSLSSMQPGQVLKVVSTDSGSWRDIPAFVDLSVHKLIEKHQQDSMFVFLIEKGV